MHTDFMEPPPPKKLKGSSILNFLGRKPGSGSDTLSLSGVGVSARLGGIRENKSDSAASTV